MRAAPATIGGMPRSSKRARLRHSATRSRSPCTTWMAIAVWPSLKVVNSCALATGMVVLRSITRSTRPPMVSRPRLSAITSSSSSSPSLGVAGQRIGLDARRRWPPPRRGSGWSALGRPNSSPTAARTSRHARAATHHHHALHLVPRHAWRRAAPCAPRPGCASISGSGLGLQLRARVTAHAQRLAGNRGCPVDGVAVAQRLLGGARGHQRGALVLARWRRARPAWASAQSARAWSMSSPPSAASPPVATTSKTPCGQAQQADVEGAAAQVVDGIQAFAAVVQAIGHGCSRGLADQAQHVQAGQLGGVLRRLALARRRSRRAR